MAQNTERTLYNHPNAMVETEYPRTQLVGTEGLYSVDIPMLASRIDSNAQFVHTSEFDRQAEQYGIDPDFIRRMWAEQPVLVGMTEQPGHIAQIMADLGVYIPPSDMPEFFANHLQIAEALQGRGLRPAAGFLTLDTFPIALGSASDHSYVTRPGLTMDGKREPRMDYKAFLKADDEMRRAAAEGRMPEPTGPQRILRKAGRPERIYLTDKPRDERTGYDDMMVTERNIGSMGNAIAKFMEDLRGRSAKANNSFAFTTLDFDTRVFTNPDVDPDAVRYASDFNSERQVSQRVLHHLIAAAQELQTDITGAFQDGLADTMHSNGHLAVGYTDFIRRLNRRFFDRVMPGAPLDTHYATALEQFATCGVQDIHRFVKTLEHIGIYPEGVVGSHLVRTKKVIGGRPQWITLEVTEVTEDDIILRDGQHERYRGEAPEHYSYNDLRAESAASVEQTGKASMIFSKEATYLLLASGILPMAPADDGVLIPSFLRAAHAQREGFFPGTTHPPFWCYAPSLSVASDMYEKAIIARDQVFRNDEPYIDPSHQWKYGQRDTRSHQMYGLYRHIEPHYSLLHYYMPTVSPARRQEIMDKIQAKKTQ